MLDGKNIQLKAAGHRERHLALSGALKNWVNISDEYQNLFQRSDMHSITVRQIRRIEEEAERLTLYTGRAWTRKNCIYYYQSMSKRLYELHGF